VSLTLIGYRHSVYTWAARMALAEAGLRAGFQDIDPFDASTAALRKHHPFGRVPVLWDGAFRLYETGAILAYLLPAVSGRKAAARARQVAGIVDAYAYWPLVRQVYAQAVFGPACGRATDLGELSAGLAAAPRVLGALDDIAAEALVLDGHDIGPADCHLAPMVGAFAEADEARAMLAGHAHLQAWFTAISARESYRTTRPVLPANGAPA
jgi:glutathione S-transferase